MSVRLGLLLLPFLCLWSLALAAQDDFKPWNEAGMDSTIEAAADSAFRPYNASRDRIAALPNGEDHEQQGKKKSGEASWFIGILGATILAGILVRYKATRLLRPFFLVASVVFLGFYRGACPCPLSGLQEVVLFASGQPFHPAPILWFLALIPITYFQGKVWCGWGCHLGALQDLFYLSAKFDLLHSLKAQKILYYLRLSALVALILQLIILHTKLWNGIDPFKTAFNLMATNTVSWVLVGILLTASVLTYRPFCKTLCPVGLVLGWVSRVPGASIIGVQAGCIGCKSCSKACKSHAFTYNNKMVTLNQQECIACGECIDACPVHAAGFLHSETTGSVAVIYESNKKQAGVLP